MKRITSALLAVILAAGIAYAVIGYNRSEVSKEITISDKYEAMENTTITLDVQEQAAEGDFIEVSGRLTDTSGKGLANKDVFVSWQGRFNTDRQFTTNSEGRFTGRKEVPRYCKDKEILTATFAGD